jgi:hypothetical protein
VWSVGVIYYQMLFGKRPFGHNQCQEQLVREDTIVNARKVEFPTRPSVSLEAKVVTIRQFCSFSFSCPIKPMVLTSSFLSYQSTLCLYCFFINRVLCTVLGILCDNKFENWSDLSPHS